VKDEVIIQQTLAVEEKTPKGDSKFTTVLPTQGLPQVTLQRIPMGKKRKVFLSKKEIEQIGFLAANGFSAREIAEKYRFSLKAVEKAIEKTKTDHEAAQRLEDEGALAYTVRQKALLILNSLTPEAINAYRDDGKIKELVQGAAILLERYKALEADLAERAGADNLKDAESMQAMFRKMAGGVALLETYMARQTARGLLPESGAARQIPVQTVEVTPE